MTCQPQNSPFLRPTCRTSDSLCALLVSSFRLDGKYSYSPLRASLSGWPRPNVGCASSHQQWERTVERTVGPWSSDESGCPPRINTRVHARGASCVHAQQVSREHRRLARPFLQLKGSQCYQTLFRVFS